MISVRKQGTVLLLLAVFLGFMGGSTQTLHVDHFSPNKEISFGMMSISESEMPFTFPNPSSTAYEKEVSEGSYMPETLSNYSLYLKLHEDESVVEGNLTVDFYNEDPEPFMSVPFHL